MQTRTERIEHYRTILARAGFHLRGKGPWSPATVATVLTLLNQLTDSVDPTDFAVDLERAGSVGQICRMRPGKRLDLVWAALTPKQRKQVDHWTAGPAELALVDQAEKE